MSSTNELKGIVLEPLGIVKVFALLKSGTHRKSALDEKPIFGILFAQESTFMSTISTESRGFWEGVG